MFEENSKVMVKGDNDERKKEPIKIMKRDSRAVKLSHGKENR